MSTLFSSVLRMSVTGSILILVVFAVRFLFKRMPARYRCTLWMIVILRLLFPVSIASPVALFPENGDWIGGYGILQETRGDQTGQVMRPNSSPAPADESAAAADSFRKVDNQSILQPAPSIGKDTPDHGKPSIKRMEWKQFLPIAWMIGVLIMIGYMILSIIRLKRSLRFAVPESLEEHHFYRSEAIEIPFLFGAFPAKIYLPYSIGKESIRHILIHEETHRKRADHLRKPLFFIALSFHWFNPLVWVAYYVFSQDMEEACDDQSISTYSAEDLKTYAEALLSVAVRRKPMETFTVAFGEVPLKNRVRRVISYRRPSRLCCAASMIVCALAAAVFFTVRTTAATPPEPLPAVSETGAEQTVRASDVHRNQSDSETADYDPEKGIPVQSENYRFIPDDEWYCYRIYGKDGDQIGGTVGYLDAVTAEDESGNKWLFSQYIDGNAWQVTAVDEELDADIRTAMGTKNWYYRPLAEYQIIMDDHTGLQFLLKNGKRRWEGHVLLWDEKDCATYDALADAYDETYRELFLESGVGYIYADMEVKGLCRRYEGGFVMLGSGQLQSVNIADPENGFLLALTNEEYDRLADWFSSYHGPQDEIMKWSFWTPILDELQVDYSSEPDPESVRYKAAMADLERMHADYGGFPPEDFTEERTKWEIRNRMKSYDEDGDLVAFGSLPGMTITSGDSTARQELIDVPEKDRQAMFDLDKEQFIRWYGLLYGDGDEKSEIYRTYQREADKPERLKGTWTLQQYDQMYTQALVRAVEEVLPDWKIGEEFDAGIVESITRERVEARLYSDGKYFHFLSEDADDE